MENTVLSYETFMERLDNTLRSSGNVFYNIDIVSNEKNKKISVEFAPYNDNWNYSINNNLTGCDYDGYDDDWSLDDIVKDAVSYFLSDVKKKFEITSDEELKNLTYIIIK